MRIMFLLTLVTLGLAPQWVAAQTQLLVAPDTVAYKSDQRVGITLVNSGEDTLSIDSLQFRKPANEYGWALDLLLPDENGFRLIYYNENRDINYDSTVVDGLFDPESFPEVRLAPADTAYIELWYYGCLICKRGGDRLMAPETLLVYSSDAAASPRQVVISPLELVSIDEPTKSQTNALLQVYPTPFRSTLRIRAAVQQPGTYSLVIYDVLGRRVYQKLLAFRAGAERTVHINAAQLDLAGGSYIIQLSGHDVSLSKKVAFVP